MVKKKKVCSPEKLSTAAAAHNPHTSTSHQINIVDTNIETTDQKTINSSTDIISKIASFKNKQFVANRGSLSSSKKSRVWKNLKQIIANDKTPAGITSYASLDATLSSKPSKKYSDLSGLPAKYRDPTTNLLYHNSDEFAQIRMSSQDIINGYLELRKANV